MFYQKTAKKQNKTKKAHIAVERIGIKIFDHCRHNEFQRFKNHPITQNKFIKRKREKLKVGDPKTRR